MSQVQRCARMTLCASSRSVKRPPFRHSRPGLVEGISESVNVFAVVVAHQID